MYIHQITVRNGKSCKSDHFFTLKWNAWREDAPLIGDGNCLGLGERSSFIWLNIDAERTNKEKNNVPNIILSLLGDN